MYAKQAILNSFKIFFKENYEYYISDSSMRNKYKREFAYGFVKGLSEKFEEQKADSELSLVVVNANVKEYLSKKNFSGVHHSRNLYISDMHCYNQGKREGRNLADIDTAMKGAS